MAMLITDLVTMPGHYPRQMPGNQAFFVNVTLNGQIKAGVIEVNKKNKVVVLTSANLYTELWNKTSVEVMAWVKQHNGTVQKYEIPEI